MASEKKIFEYMVGKELLDKHFCKTFFFKTYAVTQK